MKACVAPRSLSTCLTTSVPITHRYASEVVTRFQDRVPYVNMNGIEFMLKTLELRDPRAKTFDPANVVDSSFIQELDKSGFIDAVWKK